MPYKITKEDLRIQKTRRALYGSLAAALNRQRFAKISVHDICTDSLVSKTAFYAHFRDKYDLLGRWLDVKRTEMLEGIEGLPEQEAIQFFFETLHENMAMIINLVEGADTEQQMILYRFLVPSISSERSDDLMVLEDFIAGGLYHVIESQLAVWRRGSKEDMKKTVAYLYHLMGTMIEWDAKSETAISA